MLTTDIDHLQSSIDSLQKSLLESDLFQKLENLDSTPYVDLADSHMPPGHQGATLKELKPEEEGDEGEELEGEGEKNTFAEAPEHEPDFLAPAEFYNPYY